MNPLFIEGALSKGLKTSTFLTTYWPIINVMISCCGIVFIYNQIRALMEILAWYLYAMWYDLDFDTYIPNGIPTNNYIPDGIANFTDNTMFRPVSGLSSPFVTRFSNAELMLIFVGILVCMLSISLNILLSIRVMWKETPPNPENADWQGIWRGLGKILEAWGAAMSWDFTLEHLWDPKKPSPVFEPGTCGFCRSRKVQLIWGLACAYHALCNTILERESFRAEVQAKGEDVQVKSDQSQETPVTMSVAPVEGKKWKRASSHLERKKRRSGGGGRGRSRRGALLRTTITTVGKRKN